MSERNYKREYALRKSQGQVGTGHNSGDAKRKRARRAMEKRLGRDLAPSEVVHHKNPIKNGGSNAPSNVSITTQSANAADGGRIGDKSKKGKYKGALSKRK